MIGRNEIEENKMNGLHMRIVKAWCLHDRFRQVLFATEVRSISPVAFAFSNSFIQAGAATTECDRMNP